MMDTLPEFSAAWVMVPLLAAVILYDLRLMRIPNGLVLLFLAVAVGILPFALPLDALLWRVAIALGVLAIGLALFATGLMGGGDVKILSVLMLLIPPSALPAFGVLLSIGVLVGIIGLSVARALAKGKPTRWRALWDRKRFPLGLGIGMAGLSFIWAGPWVMGI